MGIVQKCYKFLLGFCQDNDKNKVALCKKEYFKVFIQHMTFSWLKKLVINLMIELLDDNDTANQLIKPKHVKAIC